MCLPELVHSYWSGVSSFGVVCPFPHTRHLVCPACGCYVPTGQGTHGPTLLSNVPGAHRTKSKIL